MRSVAFVSPVSGVGKSLLVYHLAHVLAERGERVLVEDDDPACSLTRLFFDDASIERFWVATSYQAYGKLLLQVAQQRATTEELDRFLEAESVRLRLPKLNASEQIVVMPSHPYVYALDQFLVSQPAEAGWHDRFTNLCRRSLEQRKPDFEPSITLADAPSGGGLMARLISAVHSHSVVVFAPTLVATEATPMLFATLEQPPCGYVHVDTCAEARVLRETRIERFEADYRWEVLGPDATEPEVVEQRLLQGDYADIFARSTKVRTQRLGALGYYPTLVEMALRARKPMHALTPADGALGAIADAVVAVRDELNDIADALLKRIDG